VIGFGTGICGLLGLGFATFNAAIGTDALVVGLSVVGLVIAVGCFFAIRALVRSLWARAVAPAAVPPPDEPPSSGAGR